MTAHVVARNVQARLWLKSIDLTFDDCLVLARAERTLHRWYEGECGDGNDYASWAIERDEETGKAYKHVYPHTRDSYRVSIPDREAGALKRIKRVCETNDLHFYVQTDPRGCALYVSTEPLDSSNYTNGYAVC